MCNYIRCIVIEVSVSHVGCLKFLVLTHSIPDMIVSEKNVVKIMLRFWFVQ